MPCHVHAGVRSAEAIPPGVSPAPRRRGLPLVLATGVPKYGPDGSFTGYIGCDIDITERKNAEDRIRATQAALEVSHQEIQYLAGRLIEAQEVERARIARDLHDDVSQQLAGVSIAFSGLKLRLGE